MSETSQVAHPTPNQVREHRDTQDRLESYLPCDWQGGVCLTRAKLKRNVAEWSDKVSLARKLDINPDAARRLHLAAVRRLVAHHCSGAGGSTTDATEPVPASNHVTPDDISRVIQEYAELHRRALTSVDLVDERDALRRQLMAMIERYRAEGRMDDPEALPTVCSWCSMALKDGKRVTTSHDCCPECLEQHFPDLEADL